MSSPFRSLPSALTQSPWCCPLPQGAHPVLRAVVVDSLVAEGWAFWPSTSLEEALLFRDYRALVRRMGGQPPVLEVEQSVHVVYSNLYTKEHVFAVRIQAAWRGLRARLFTRTLRVLHASARGREAPAALAIQRLVRGTWGRRAAAARARRSGVGSTLERYRSDQRCRSQEEGAVDLRGRLFRAYTTAREQERTSRFLGLYRPNPSRGVMASFLRSAVGRGAVDADAYRALFTHATSELREREERGRRLRTHLRWLESKVGGLAFGAADQGAATASTREATGGHSSSRGAPLSSSGHRRRRSRPHSSVQRPASGAPPGTAVAEEAAAEGHRRAAYVQGRFALWRAYYAEEIRRVESAFEELYMAAEGGRKGAQGGGSGESDGVQAALRYGQEAPPPPRVRAALSELFDPASLDALGISLSARAPPRRAGKAGGHALLRDASSALALAQRMRPGGSAGTLPPLERRAESEGGADSARERGSDTAAAAAAAESSSSPHSFEQGPARPRSLPGSARGSREGQQQRRGQEAPSPAPLGSGLRCSDDDATMRRQARRVAVERRVRAGKLKTLHKMALHADSAPAPGGGGPSTFRAKRDAIRKQQHVAVAYARGKEAAAALGRKSGPLS